MWSLTSKKNLDTINVLQKKCIRIINFAEINSHTNPLFIENHLIKFEDIIESTYLKLIFDFKNRNLPADLYSLFEFSDNIHRYNTRISSYKGIFIPPIRTTNFGNKSLRYAASILWNEFVNKDKSLLSLKHKNELKKYLKNHYQSKYSCL